MFSTVDKAGSEHIAVRQNSMIDKVGVKQAKSRGPHVCNRFHQVRDKWK